MSSRRKPPNETAARASSPFAPVVAIGGSVGALPAFTKLLARMPEDTGMAFVVLQHLDPKRDSLLTQLLSASSRMPVHEVREDMRLAPNQVYVVPPAHAVSYVAGAFRLGPRRNPTIPSDLIDTFMGSLAAAQGSRAVGIVLSGNGRDGVAGLSAIRAAGGATFCQPPASARSDAMPRAAIAAGVVDFVLDAEQMSIELARIGQSILRSRARARASTSVSSQSPLFERVSNRDRLYKPSSELTASAGRDAQASSTRVSRKPCILPVMGYDARKEADRVLLGRFVSAAILVDAQLQVIQFRGQTGPFIGPLSGAASLHVLKLVDETLLPALRYGLAAVQRTKRGYRRRGLVAQLQGVPRELDLEIIPLPTPQTDELSCLIVFGGVSRLRDGDRTPVGSAKGAGGRLLAQLRDELAMTRDHLQASLAEQESSNESLRATLEELQSTNEELQVTNEELETGKEELQSTNEELTTAHEQVQMRNAELNQLVHDQVNLVEGASVAAALFGPDLRLRRVTPLAATFLRLVPSDIGRALAGLETGIEGCDLSRTLTAVMASEGEQQQEAHNDAGQRFVLTFRPYRSVEGLLEGAVLTMLDVTKLRASEEALALAEQRISVLERAAFTMGASN